MRTINKLFRPSLLVLTVMAAGCQETSGPNTALRRLNAAAALADYNAMDGVFESGGWKRFQMTAGKMDVAMFGSGPATAARATAALQELAQGDPRAFAAALSDVSAASVPLISTDNRGKTFVYSAQLHNWVVDPTR